MSGAKKPSAIGNIEQLCHKVERRIATCITDQGGWQVDAQALFVGRPRDGHLVSFQNGHVQPFCQACIVADNGLFAGNARQMDRFGSGQGHFQHGHQLHIPIVQRSACADFGVVDAANLPLVVAGGPIQHIHAVPKMLGIGGAHFKSQP